MHPTVSIQEFLTQEYLFLKSDQNFAHCIYGLKRAYGRGEEKTFKCYLEVDKQQISKSEKEH